MQFKLSSTLIKCVRSIKSAGGKVYVVGGAVRDTLLKRPIKDIDLVTDLRYASLTKAIADAGLFLADDKTAESHLIARVTSPEGLIDIATLRKDISTDGRHAVVEPTDKIEEDLARRDLTINAIAVEIDDEGKQVGNLIDPFGGELDLYNARIKLVGDPDKRITEDYLRMMRVARFATLLDYKGAKLDPATVQACRKYAPEIMSMSVERIRDEIMKALTYDNAGWMFRHMRNLGLLEHVIPDLHIGVATLQNKYHQDPVFEHLCFCVDNCKGKKYTPLLKLATLFHDIAKPHTRKIIKGDATFYKHEVVGAQITYQWMKTYKFSSKDIQYVVKMVRHHQWRFEDNTTDKAYRKWLQEVGKEHWRDLIRLRMADRKGNRAKSNRPAITSKMKDLIRNVRRIIRLGQPIFVEDLAINGNDLKELGVKPGPIYKDIFSNILGLVLVRPEINTKEWLTNFVKKNYVDKKPEDNSNDKQHV